MIAVLLILIPLIGGLALFALKGEAVVKGFALLASFAALAVSVGGLLMPQNSAALQFDAAWIPTLNSRFHIGLDGMGQLLCLLTSIAFPIIFIASWNNKYKNANRFYALMLLSQAGLMGVFLSMDALLFYFCWELALIPVYFLSSIWGGEKRIAVTFKFFIYTFFGSLLMLIGILMMYFKAGQSFDLNAWYGIKGNTSETMMFWLFFIAFAIKMPIWPLHTWQPDTYEQSPTAVTMVLSGIMVKMGVFAVLRWLVPVFPLATYENGDTISMMCLIGMIYASLIAIKQDDIKRLIAYSSIAHIGLMCLAIFASNKSGLQGATFQMFVHGINIIGLWIVADTIEQKYGTRKISELGGIAQKAPVLSILLVIIALANIALPLTNAFPGEFMMFNGIFSSTVTKYNKLDALVAGITIILSAVYTLNMIRRVFFGELKAATQNVLDTSAAVKVSLAIIVVLIFVMGIYPKPVLQLTNDVIDVIVLRMQSITKN
ncbi:MAG: NADH-quinone oxidoreductase subunit M [Gemmatimonadaceae bacterium]|nr:NADH-quinone oxidoreductase subunit M [Chitinophagaceae bacterium]